MEENRTPDFTSTVVMGREEHAEFSSVSYLRTREVMIVYVILAALYTVFFSQPTEAPLKISAFLLFLSLLIYILGAINIRQRWKQRVAAEGKDSTTFTVSFGEKISVGTDQHEPVDFDYAAITSLKETEHYYLLGMKPRLYIIIDKAAAESAGFLPVLLDRCPNIKGRKPQCITGARRTCLIWLSLHGALVLFTLIRHLM